MSLSATSR